MSPNLLRHGIAREVFACRVATNARDVLRGQSAEPDYADLPDLATVSILARERWLVPRADRMPQFRAWRRDALLELLAQPRWLPALRRAVQGG
jgi:hypothetical protein